MQAGELAGYEVIYLDLHGEADRDYLFTTDGIPVLDLETVRKAKLGGAVVVATSCYLPESGFVEALLEAGARAVIAGRGQNYGAIWWLTGAQALARAVLRGLKRGLVIENALAEAKWQLRRSVLRMLSRRAVEDALAFQVFRGGRAGRISTSFAGPPGAHHDQEEP
jgi:hypothetical protein